MITCRGCGRVIDSDYGIYCAECKLPSKVCAHCGVIFYQGYGISARQYVAQRTCSYRCRGAHQVQTRMERVTDMEQCGYADFQIAKELGVTEETLQRYRLRDRQMGRTP